MDKLILTVNEYPWTSFFVFLAIYSLMGLVSNLVEDILKIFKNK